MKKNLNIRLAYGKKGTILLYFIVYLNVIALLITRYCYEVEKYVMLQQQINEFREFAFVEVLTIKHVKQSYIDYEEEDEILTYKQFTIEIKYDNLKATICIKNEETDKERTRILVFDDLEELVEDYY